MAFGKARPARPGEVTTSTVKQTSLDQAERQVSGENVSRLVNGVCVLCVGAFLATGVYAAYPHVAGALAPAEAEAKPMAAKRDNGSTVFSGMGGGLARMGRASGKKSCDDFTAREIVEAQLRNTRRLKGMKKARNKGQGAAMAQGLGFIMPGAQGDMAAISCATAFGSMFGGSKSKGRFRTVKEREVFLARRAKKIRSLRKQMGVN